MTPTRADFNLISYSSCHVSLDIKANIKVRGMKGFGGSADCFAQVPRASPSPLPPGC